jgi:UDP-N-acetylmuramyl pentapeptide phosphotransferase/UDP-N-acetylglucosamine-1-phosphate transferase
MENIIISAIFSFIITFYAIPIIIQVSTSNKLFDHPDERKLHSNPIPSLGGAGIFGGFLISFLIMVENTASTQNLQYYIASFIITFFVGLKDDVLIISPMKKFIGQVFIASILIFKANLVIATMHGFLGVGLIHPTFSYFLSAFTIIVVMNAFNLIDGVDALAGSIGIITSTVFGIFFFMNGDTFFAMMGFTFAASLLAFTVYNYSPARIFMGDTGSMLVGLVNAILVIRFIETAENSNLFPILGSPAMGFGILAVPLLDTLRVFSKRILHGRSPFSPDRNHLHHILLDKGFSHNAVTLILSATTVLIIVVTYFALPLGTTKVIMSQIALFFIAIAWLTSSKTKVTGMKVVKNNIDDENEISRKVRNIFSYTENAAKTGEKD